MSQPTVKAVLLSPQRKLGGRPLLVVGPSLGTSSVLWEEAGALLGGDFDVVAWDLPGHGISPAAVEGFSVAELATSVVALVDSIAPGERFHYAGVSLGGATGLQLALDHQDRLLSLSVQCSGAKLGTPEGWTERAETVRRLGTPVMIQGSAARWFGPGFMEREPEISSRLLHALRDADRFSYAWCCDALAGFDVRDRLGEISVPTLAVAGRHDQVATPAIAEEMVRGITDGGGTASVVELDNVAHLAPAEAPARVASLLRDFIAGGHRQGAVRPDATSREIHDAGMRVRREVLGDAHVDRANAAKDDFTGDYQDMITRIAWGGIWTRPGLSRQMRSAITLTALIAHGHWDELAMHVRAALNNGLSRDEIREVLLQSAIYCGVPAANSAFKTAQAVFAQLDGQPERMTPDPVHPMDSPTPASTLKDDAS
jgi:3-oxoadipate enol-lactonase/4-carboxymuconolactone decarboxylase